MVVARSGAAVRAVHAQREPLGELGRAKGIGAVVSIGWCTGCRDNDRRTGPTEHRGAL